MAIKPDRAGVQGQAQTSTDQPAPPVEASASRSMFGHGHHHQPPPPPGPHGGGYPPMQWLPLYVDESVLWTERRDVGDGFRCIRMVNNIYLNLDAFHRDKAHGGVHDGTEVVLWEWAKGDNQRWKILSWC